MREIEIKLRVPDLDALEKKLTDAGLVISKEIAQHDAIYSKDTSIFTRMLKEGEIVVRIRKEDDIFKLTLKQQRTSELDNTEYEIIVQDGQIMHNILLLLGWKPEIEVKKVRKKGKIGDYEVCLDKVEGLGNFIELEKMTNDDTDPEKVKQELFNALKPFGLSEQEQEIKGYDILMYQLNKK